MKRRKTAISPVFKGRRLFLMLTLLTVIGFLLLRAAWLEVFQQSMLQERAQKRQTRVVSVPAYRGMILDRNGDPMAVSSPVEALWCNPRILLAERRDLLANYDEAYDQYGPEDARTIAAAQAVDKLENGLLTIENVLNLDRGALLDRLEAASSKSFLYLERQLPPMLAEKIMALEISGVESKPEYRRFYPLAETSGHVVGMTNIDGRGIEGVEKAKNDVLAGRSGKKKVVRDGRRRIIEDIESIEPMIPGQAVKLSIDRRIQYIAYRELKKQVSRLDARAGSIIVMDAHTGEVLALANLPSFNPNNRKDLNPAQYRNRAVTDKFEPGSTLKPLTVAAGLEARVIDASVEIDTSPGHISFGKYKVSDPGNYGSISLSALLAKSSNVGATRIALMIRPRDHWMFLSRIGFGQIPAVGLPGETAGVLRNYDEWGEVDHATHGYGYGLSASLLQLTHAYTPFAAKGKLAPATIYKRDKAPLAMQAMTPETATSVLNMMQAVVTSSGTGRRAMIEGYHVAGKTGTAYKFADGEYQTDRYITSFIGIAPASRPRLVVAVQLDEPQKDDSGGRAAAPVFSKVMSESLRLLDIPPDDLQDLQQVKTNEQQGGAT